MVKNRRCSNSFTFDQLPLYEQKKSMCLHSPESLVINFIIFLIFIFPQKMRDERYYQRLNEIRQKYGYLNLINPEQQFKKIQEKRQPIPASQHHPPQQHHYLDGYKLPAKQVDYHAATNVMLEVRRAKENNSTPPQVYQREVATDRGQRQYPPTNTRLTVQNRDNYSHSEYPTSFTHLQNVVSKEYTSPIKRLQGELSSKNTPRQYAQNIQRGKICQVGQVSSTKNGYKTQVANITERSQIPYDTVIEEAPRNTPKMTDRTERSFNKTPRQAKQSQNIIQNLYSNKQGEQFSSKFNDSLNNIDKLQQKIQAMLSKPKK